MTLGGLPGLWRTVARNDQVVLALVGLLVGVAAAYAAIAFRLAIAGVQWLGFGFADESVASKAALLPAWQVVLVPTVGCLLIGLFIRYLMPGRRSQAVQHVIEAAALHDGRMDLRTGLAAAAVSAATLGVGGSAGREGPVVHLGGAVASWIATRVRLHADYGRTILGCGVAAAVAASFNAPLAGVFFALEVVIGHYALSAFAPVVVASVAGTVICHLHVGAQPAFDLPPNSIVSNLEFPAFLLLGLVCAAVAMIFMWSLVFAEDVAERVRVPIWLKTAAAGLMVGVIALAFPEVLGVGYEATDAALREQFPLWMLIVLVAAKTAATAATLGSGLGGGVFSPSLFIGAMTGGAFGLIAAAVFPDMAASHGAYAIVGMSAVAAAVLGAPISTILIVFELTGDYRMLIAVMLATAASTVLAQQVLGKSLFHWQLERRGLRLRGGRGRQLLLGRSVRDLMSGEIATLPEDTAIGEVRRRMRQSPVAGILVVDAEGRLLGTLGAAELQRAALDPELKDNAGVREIARREPAVLEPGDGLESALAAMEASGEELIPVVDSRAACRPVGVLRYRDVLRAQNDALLQAQAEEHGEAAPTSLRRRRP